MARKTESGFDRWFSERMKNPRFAREYAQARAKIDATDALVRSLDRIRELSGITKAELARRVSAKPEIVRRLLTSETANPTMKTVLELVSALGYHLELVPNRPARSTRKAVRRPAAARARKNRAATTSRSAEPGD